MIRSGGLPPQLAAYQAMKAYSDAPIAANGSIAAKPQTKTSAASDTFTLLRTNAADGALIGGWGEPGSSASIYRPTNFNPSSPAYKVRVWGADGRPSTRTIAIANIDPRNADEAEMLAFTSHAEATGAYTSATRTFMAARAYVKAYGGTTEDRIDWLGIADGAMQSEYRAGNMLGFIAYKQFWDMLSASVPQGEEETAE